MSYQVMQQIKSGYKTCLMWADFPRDEDDQELDNNGISEELDQVITKDIQLFIDKAGDLIDQALDTEGYYLEYVGHDFWVTRNGHGAGFWDGDLPEKLGDELTRIAKEFGEVDLYLDDNQLICS